MLKGLLLFSTFLNKVIVYTPENNNTEERELVIGSQKPGLYVTSKKLDSAVEI